MLKLFHQINLKTKLIIIIFGMFVLTMVFENIYIIHVVNQRYYESESQKVEEVAKMIADSEEVPLGLLNSQQKKSRTLQQFAERSRKLAKVEFITIFDMNGIRYTHPNEQEIGQLVVGGDFERALKGEAYHSIADGTLGTSIRAFEPIFDQNGTQIGVVLVGETINKVDYLASRTINSIILSLIFSLVIAMIIAFWLFRSIKKTMLGLEPTEMVKLYRERDAIIHTVKEGIVVVNREGKITQINEEAKRILKVDMNNPIGRDVNLLIPNTRLYEVMLTEKPEYNYKQNINGIVILTSRTPLIVDGKLIGAVATFKDMTEIQTLAENLTGVNKYADALRSQSHEFKNKLHVIYGLVFAKRQNELLSYLEDLMGENLLESGIVTQRIKDPILSGFLNSKYSRAKELDVHLVYHINGSLSRVNNISITHRLVTILGNLIDNSFEAVQYLETKNITVQLTIEKEEFIIQIFDSGLGISSDIIKKIFEKGFSTKGEDRGLGLYLVLSCIEELGGDIIAHHKEEQNLRFTVTLPLSEIYQEDFND